MKLSATSPQPVGICEWKANSWADCLYWSRTVEGPLTRRTNCLDVEQSRGCMQVEVSPCPCLTCCCNTSALPLKSWMQKLTCKRYCQIWHCSFTLFWRCHFLHIKLLLHTTKRKGWKSWTRSSSELQLVQEFVFILSPRYGTTVSGHG